MTPAVVRSMHPRRVAVLSVHTSPLEQPGTGDAGGMNVYVVETSKLLAARGIEVEIFTRATSSDLPPVVELAPGVTVRNLVAGPFEGLSKEDLPAQLCALTSGVLRAEAQHEPGWYDVVHSHYWLSGQVGWLASERWGTPLVHTAHTLAKVKNLALAEGDSPEPLRRVVGEEQVVAAADRLVANTAEEARQLVDLYGAEAARVVTVAPGVDLEHFRPGEASGARTRLGVPPDAVVLLFVGRIQPLKAPDVLLRAAARMLEQDPSLRDRLVVAVVGGPSGTGLAEPEALQHLARSLHLDDITRFELPSTNGTLLDWYRAATVVAVPSHNESFGLVALEAQACGTPVVATDVGGLRTTVRDGVSGLLVPGHAPEQWAGALRRAIADRPRLAAGAVEHASHFSWSATADGLLDTFRDALADRADDRLAAYR
ncbi:MAG: D-inositol-3-phosphate glycosyltransferase [Actinobacteria bacterium]|nr:D-inositol-3-phosphate glycosyltransferase [Actinomycetota bacterium]MCA1721259.1 D-inositol-3-phosphate glycosyltransferase [Actinomycetota bacterium]